MSTGLGDSSRDSPPRDRRRARAGGDAAVIVLLMIRIILIVLEILIGVGALGGGTYAVMGARGVPREWLNGSPFKSYLVPGLFLVVVVGASMLTAAGLLLAHHGAARLVSLEAGVALLGWIGAQVSVIGYRSWQQPLFFALGLAVVVLSVAMRGPG